jgi:hypothetical protein
MLKMEFQLYNEKYNYEDISYNLITISLLIIYSIVISVIMFMKEVPVEVVTQKNNKEELLLTKNMESVQIALKKWNEAYIKCFVPYTREARYNKLKKIRDNSYNIENNFWEIIKNLSDEENYHNLVNEEELARQEAINAIKKANLFDEKICNSDMCPEQYSYLAYLFHS